MALTPAIYPLWEDAIGEKQITLTRITNPQLVYIANYEWALYANNKKLQIVPNFEEEIEAECHFKVKLRYKDHEVQILQRKEPVFPLESGVSFEILEAGWESIDITFRIARINDKLYIGPTDEPYFSATVTVQDVRVHVDVERLTCESNVFASLRAISYKSEITIYDMDADLFLELLRILNPPHKPISRFNFVDILLLGFRFQMPRLLQRVNEFAKGPEYDKHWVSKWTLKKIDRLVEADPTETIQVLDLFRAEKRAKKPVKKVMFRKPEIQIIKQEVAVVKPSCLTRIADYCSNHKTRLIYTLLTLLFLENLFLFVWFTSIYRMSNDWNY